MEPYILRTSEGNAQPKLVEYLQNGILIRFDIQKVEKTDKEILTFFRYKEFWFDSNEPDIEKILEDNGYELNDEYKSLLLKP